MGWAADDLYDDAMREQEMVDCLLAACKCKDWHWVLNEDCVYECKECGEMVEL